MLILVSCLIVHISITNVAGSNVTILGMRPEDTSSTVNKDGSLEATTGKDVNIIVFGNGITQDTKVSFTDKLHDDMSCVRKRESYPRDPQDIINAGSFRMTEFFEKADTWFLCVEDNEGILWKIESGFTRLTVKTDGVPGWARALQVICICILLVLSGLFSGLNLGLMALNPDELQVVKNVGSETERKYAAKIFPLRKHGNFLLCTLLLGNVIVNTTATVMLDNLTGSGLAAIFGSAAGIVVFGEIVPQSVCTRHGLAVGAKTIWLTKFFMIITAVVSWPLSKLLDCLFGEEIGQRNNRDKFIEMAKLSQQKGDEHFDPNTVAIIDGAFQLKEKCVKDVMTPIEKVFMIDYNERLTFELISKISEKGFTRIPVFKKEDSTRNIVGIIFVKDLIFIDPTDNMPIKAICDHTNHQLMFTYEEITLDHILAEFKTGSSHMAIVQKPVSVPGKDPYYEITGVVTLEDVIEEMIGSEIIDETDYFVDNTGRHRANRHRKMDFKAFLHQPSSTVFPPQLKLACFQYLHSEIEAFGPSRVHSSVLKKLMECNVLFEIKLDTAVNDQSHVLYRKNVPSEYFILILEGRASVSVGKDNLTFEAGPFHYFGEAVLNPTAYYSETEDGGKPRANSIMSSSHESAISGSKINSPTHKEPIFMPDFTVTATSNLVIFKIKQRHYMAAVKTSQMIYDQLAAEKSGSTTSPDDIDSKAHELKEMENVEKLLSDELSKVDAQEKGLAVIAGSISANTSSELVGSVTVASDSFSEDKNNRHSLGRSMKSEHSPSVRFSDAPNVAENGRVKSGGAKDKKKDKEEQPLLSTTSRNESVRVSMEDEDTSSAKT